MHMIVSLQLHIYISYNNIVKQKRVKQLRNLVSLVEQAQGEPRATPAMKGPGRECLSQQALPVSKRLGGVLNGSSAPLAVASHTRFHDNPSTQAIMYSPPH